MILIVTFIEVELRKIKSKSCLIVTTSHDKLDLFFQFIVHWHIGRRTEFNYENQLYVKKIYKKTLRFSWNHNSYLMAIMKCDLLV